MNELYNADVPADVGRTVQPFDRSAGHGFRLYSVLLGCIFFLAAGVRADEPQPGDSPDSHHQHSVEGAGTRDALVAVGKGRSGNSSVGSQFEQPPQRIDFLKLEQLQRDEAVNRERSRKRIMLPSEAVASQSGDSLLIQLDRGSKPALATGARAPMSNDFRSLFGAALLFFAAGIIALHKFTSGFVGFTQTLFNPWVAEPATDTRSGPIELAGEKFFSEFQARFRVDAPAPGVNQFGGLSHADILKSARRCVRRMQKLMRDVRLTTEEAVQRKKIGEISDKLRLFSDLLSHSDLLPLQQMISALEPLTGQLAEKSENITSSTIRTLSQSIDLLADLCLPNLNPELFSRPPPLPGGR